MSITSFFAASVYLGGVKDVSILSATFWLSIVYSWRLFFCNHDPIKITFWIQSRTFFPSIRGSFLFNDTSVVRPGIVVQRHSLLFLSSRVPLLHQLLSVTQIPAAMLFSAIVRPLQPIYSNPPYPEILIANKFPIPPTLKTPPYGEDRCAVTVGTKTFQFPTIRY